MSAAKCKYGDVESVELVDCKYNEQLGTLLCPQPTKRLTRRTSDQKASRLEMDVHFMRDDGISKKKTFVVEYNDSDESDELLMGKEKQPGTPTVHTEQKVGRKREWARFVKKALALTLADLIGELIGTFLLTLVSCSIVASAVVTGAQSGLWQVAIVVGVGVTLSIYCTSHFSDAHLNPAVTLAFSIVRWKIFSWKKVIPYILAQILGSFCAGGVVYGLYQHAIEQYETEHDIIRGTNASVITAMVFGEYFPNPDLFDHTQEKNLAVVSIVQALIVEAWTACILVFIIFCFTDKNNTAVGSGSDKVAVPVLIGVTVAILISLYGSLTQVGMNPARDFGPRIFAAIAGWGRIAIPGPRQGFWVYIVGPLFGGVVGGGFYDIIVSNVLRLAKAAKHKSMVTTSCKLED